MGKIITWDGEKRELKKYDCNIVQYYKGLAERWNLLSEHINEPKDGRTNFYKDYNNFFWELVYMWDMIVQTQQEHEARINEQAAKIRLLESELKKWTEQQTGRKSILSDKQKKQIFEWKQEPVSNREIARRLDVSEGTIRNALKEKN